MRTWLTLMAVALSALSFAVLSRPTPARACGGFFSPKLAEAERRPALAYEQTLIIHDHERRREHFVRNVVFRTSRRPFGFVVPTPSRPEVAKVAHDPFVVLRASFPYGQVRAGTGSGQGFGSGAGRRGGPVKVLEVKKVGSFTAFVLAADDAKALADWLQKNHLVSTPQADAWLAHYVRMKFFYVAMRYDPPAEDRRAVGRTVSETMRISFDSELGYYPYFEPDPPPGEAHDDPRLLELWYVAAAKTVPVAIRSKDKKLSWVRALAEGWSYAKSPRMELAEALGQDAGLLPDGELVVQRFMDQKRLRVGFGDVVFVPAEASSRRVSPTTPLLGVLDPSLAEGTR